jgi:hypothetical protein
MLNNRLTLIVLICFLATSAGFSQEKSLNLEGSNLFVTTNQNPLIEIITSEHHLNNIGDINKMLMNSREQLVVLSDSNHILVMDLSGKVISLSHQINCKRIALGKDDYIYALLTPNETVTESHNIARFTPELKLDSIISLQGFKTDYDSFLGFDLDITDNNEILLLNRKPENSNSATRYEVFLFSLSGKKISGFNISDKDGNYFTYSQILASPGNDILLMNKQHGKIEFYNPQGKFLKSFNYPEHNSPHKYFNLTYDNKLVFSGGENYIDILNLDGEKLESKYLYTESLQEYRFKDVFLNREGEYVVSRSEGWRTPKSVITLYDSNGNFEKFISSALDSTYPTDAEKLLYPLYSGSFCLDGDGHFWTVSAHDRCLAKLNRSGKVVQIVPFEELLYDAIIRINKQGNLVLLSNNILYFVSKDGKVTRKKNLEKYFVDCSASDMELTSSGNILIGTDPYSGYKCDVLLFNNKGKFKKKLIKGINHLFNFDIDAKGNIYTLESGNNVLKYSPTGNYISSFNDSAGTQVCAGNNGDVFVLDSSEDRLRYLDSKEKILADIDLSSISFDPSFAFDSEMVFGPDGILYILGKHNILALNNHQRYQAEVKTGILQGRVKYVSKSLKSLPLPSMVYLEGTDSKGINFSSISKVDEKGFYRFSGIPHNSKVQVWAHNRFPEFAAYKTPVYSQNFLHQSMRRNFKLKAFSPVCVFIRGRVTSKEGSPLAGAVVKAGWVETTTNLSGCYSLPLIPNAYYDIAATHPKASFSTEERWLDVKDKDISLVNFQAK